MISYQDIKTWWGQKENKDKVVLGISFVLVFLVGFGTGSFVRESRPVAIPKTQANYSTAAPKTPSPKPAAAVPAAAAASSTAPASCLIKGNISTGGRKIYHVPGGALYNVVKPEQCFNTEAEAAAAGFVKSGR